MGSHAFPSHLQTEFSDVASELDEVRKIKADLKSKTEGK
jgi:hypothetical protein